MDKLKMGAGIVGILTSFIVKDFRPTGWTTRLLWGKGEDVRIPRWVAAPFYFILGVVLLYYGLKH